MNTLVTYLFSQYHSGKEAQWLRRSLYAFLLYKCFYWFINYDLLFGAKSIVTISYAPQSFVKSLAYLFYYSNSSIVAAILLGVALLLGLNGLFFNILPRFAAFVTWFLVCNIDNAVYPTLHGGDRLFEQLLFFNILLSAQKEIKRPAFADADKALHNFGVMTIVFQICVVYFISGSSKFLNADWMNGIAVMQTSRVEEFSIPLLYGATANGFFKFLNYSVMIYQLLFPIAIWFKKIKKPFLILGIIQHLYIAFILGLPSFGFIMIIAYSIFYVPGRVYQIKSIN